MNKFQMKITRFARFMYVEGDWRAPCIYLGFVAVLLMLGSYLLLVDYYNSKKIIGIVYLLISFSPLITVAIVALLSKLIYNWASKRFLACFRLPAYTDEKNILEKLRKLAVWLGEELAISDTIGYVEVRKSRVRFAKKRFWSMWRLAKAMGFPVFKSWWTHAQVRFIKIKF